MYYVLCTMYYVLCIVRESARARCVFLPHYWQLISECVRCKVFIISAGLHPGAAETDATGCFHQRLRPGERPYNMPVTDKVVG